jgi:hypothetical protein
MTLHLGFVAVLRTWLRCLAHGHAWDWRFYYSPPENADDKESCGRLNVCRDCANCGAFRVANYRARHWCQNMISFIGTRRDGTYYDTVIQSPGGNDEWRAGRYAR